MSKTVTKKCLKCGAKLRVLKRLLGIFDGYVCRGGKCRKSKGERSE